AEMGFRTVEEMIGRVDRIDVRPAIKQWKARGVDLGRILHQVPLAEGKPLHQTGEQDHGLAAALDVELIEAARPAIEQGEPLVLEREIRNVNRTVGAMLSGVIAKSHGHTGLKPDTLRVNFTGVAGQSFGAWLAHGVTLD